MNQAVILAGGRGARLAPFNTVLPKPLMPLGEVSVLEIVLRRLDRAGFDEAILATGYLSEIIEAFCKSLGPKLRLDLRFVREEEPRGTVGPLRGLSGLEEHFLLMNGDVLTDLPFDRVLEAQRGRGSIATLAVAEREVVIDFGILSVDPDGSVSRYTEKPTLRHLVSLGVYAFSREILEWIPASGKFDLPDLVQLLIEGNRRVNTYPFKGYWKDIGRIEDYESAKEDFLRNPERFLGES